MNIKSSSFTTNASYEVLERDRNINWKGEPKEFSSVHLTGRISEKYLRGSHNEDDTINLQSRVLTSLNETEIISTNNLTNEYKSENCQKYSRGFFEDETTLISKQAENQHSYIRVLSNEENETPSVAYPTFSKQSFSNLARDENHVYKHYLRGKKKYQYRPDYQSQIIHPVERFDETGAPHSLLYEDENKCLSFLCGPCIRSYKSIEKWWKTTTDKDGNPLPFSVNRKYFCSTFGVFKIFQLKMLLIAAICAITIVWNAKSASYITHIFIIGSFLNFLCVFILFFLVIFNLYQQWFTLLEFYSVEKIYYYIATPTMTILTFLLLGSSFSYSMIATFFFGLICISLFLANMCLLMTSFSSNKNETNEKKLSVKHTSETFLNNEEKNIEEDEKSKTSVKENDLMLAQNKEFFHESETSNIKDIDEISSNQPKKIEYLQKISNYEGEERKLKVFDATKLADESVEEDIAKKSLELGKELMKASQDAIKDVLNEIEPDYVIQRLLETFPQSQIFKTRDAKLRDALDNTPHQILINAIRSHPSSRVDDAICLNTLYNIHKAISATRLHQLSEDVVNDLIVIFIHWSPEVLLKGLQLVSPEAVFSTLREVQVDIVKLAMKIDSIDSYRFALSYATPSDVRQFMEKLPSHVLVCALQQTPIEIVWDSLECFSRNSLHKASRVCDAASRAEISDLEESMKESERIDLSEDSFQENVEILDNKEILFKDSEIISKNSSSSSPDLLEDFKKDSSSIIKTSQEATNGDSNGEKSRNLKEQSNDPSIEILDDPCLKSQDEDTCFESQESCIQANDLIESTSQLHQLDKSPHLMEPQNSSQHSFRPIKNVHKIEEKKVDSFTQTCNPLEIEDKKDEVINSLEEAKKICEGKIRFSPFLTNDKNEKINSVEMIKVLKKKMHVSCSITSKSSSSPVKEVSIDINEEEDAKKDFTRYKSEDEDEKTFDFFSSSNHLNNLRSDHLKRNNRNFEMTPAEACFDLGFMRFEAPEDSIVDQSVRKVKSEEGDNQNLIKSDVISDVISDPKQDLSMKSIFKNSKQSQKIAPRQRKIFKVPITSSLSDDEDLLPILTSITAIRPSPHHLATIDLNRNQKSKSSLLESVNQTLKTNLCETKNQSMTSLTTISGFSDFISNLNIDTPLNQSAAATSSAANHHLNLSEMDEDEMLNAEYLNPANSVETSEFEYQCLLNFDDGLDPFPLVTRDQNYDNELTTSDDDVIDSSFSVISAGTVCRNVLKKIYFTVGGLLGSNKNYRDAKSEKFVEDKLAVSDANDQMMVKNQDQETQEDVICESEFCEPLISSSEDSFHSTLSKNIPKIIVDEI